MFILATLLFKKKILLNVQVVSADGTQDIGKISKQWGGLAKEYFTDADNFGIQCMYCFCACTHECTHTPHMRTCT